MTVIRVLLALALEAQILFTTANTQRALLHLIKHDHKPEVSPLKSFPVVSLLQCGSVCSKTETCKSVAFGSETCFMYEADYTLNELTMANGFRYYTMASRYSSGEAETEVTTYGTEATTTISTPLLNKGLKTSQSSRNTSGYAIDGEDDRKVPTITPHCSSTNPDSDTKPWWRYKLDEEFLLRKVTIYTSENDQLYNIAVHIGADDVMDTALGNLITKNQICVKVTGLLSTNTDTEFGQYVDLECDVPVVGNYLSIQITDFCTEKECLLKDTNILSLCKVMIYPELRLGNVALKKPAKQSTTTNSKQQASIAVDGVTNQDFQHTEFKSQYAWWRVDLQQNHYVKEVIVYNLDIDKNNQRFHDVDIRVSQEDIAEIKSETVFKENDQSTLCFHAGDKTAVPGGKNIFTCKKSLVGRYVSLQIVKDCDAKRTDCNGDGEVKTMHVINIYEVEVIGFPMSNIEMVDVWRNHNLVESTSHQGISKKEADVDKYRQSSIWNGAFSAVWADSDIPSLQLYTPTLGKCAFTDYAVNTPSWWQVTLNATYLVEKVIISTPVELHDFVIRVGNSDITPPPKENDVCKEGISLPLSNGEAEAECNLALKGKYVSIEVLKPCGRKECVFFKSTALYICEVKVQVKLV